MVAVPLSDLAPLLAAKKRLAGLDVGTKTIGLAVADVLGMIASPAHTIRRTKFTADAQELMKFIKERGIHGLVIGLPINMDGTEGPRCQSIRQFATNLEQMVDLPMAFWDERLSTAAVNRLMIEADLTRKRRSELVDKMAASYILQGALDFLARHPGPAA